MYTLVDLGSYIYMADPEMMEEAKELSKSAILFDSSLMPTFLFQKNTCHDNILKHLVKR